MSRPLSSRAKRRAEIERRAAAAVEPTVSRILGQERASEYPLQLSMVEIKMRCLEDSEFKARVCDQPDFWKQKAIADGLTTREELGRVQSEGLNREQESALFEDFYIKVATRSGRCVPGSERYAPLGHCARQAAGEGSGVLIDYFLSKGALINDVLTGAIEGRQQRILARAMETPGLIALNKIGPVLMAAAKTNDATTILELNDLLGTDLRKQEISVAEAAEKAAELNHREALEALFVMSPSKEVYRRALTGAARSSTRSNPAGFGFFDDIRSRLVREMEAPFLDGAAYEMIMIGRDINFAKLHPYDRNIQERSAEGLAQTTRPFPDRLESLLISDRSLFSSALRGALKKGDLVLIRRLFDQHPLALPQIPRDLYMIPIQRDQLDILTFLLSIRRPPRDLLPLLEEAARFDRREMIDELVRRSKNPQEELDRVVLRGAIDGGHLRSIREILSHGIRPSQADLNLAAERGDREIFEELFRFRTDEIDAIDLVLRAANAGNRNIVEYLDQLDFSPRLIDRLSETFQEGSDEAPTSVSYDGLAILLSLCSEPNCRFHLDATLEDEDRREVANLITCFDLHKNLRGCYPSFQR